MQGRGVVGRRSLDPASPSRTAVGLGFAADPAVVAALVDVPEQPGEVISPVPGSFAAAVVGLLHVGDARQVLTMVWLFALHALGMVDVVLQKVVEPTASMMYACAVRLSDEAGDVVVLIGSTSN